MAHYFRTLPHPCFHVWLPLLIDRINSSFINCNFELHDNLQRSLKYFSCAEFIVEYFLSPPLMCKRMAHLKGRRMFNFREILPIVLYGIFICNVPTVGAEMIRRKQFLQDKPYQKPFHQFKSDLTGCSEPCTTEVLDLAERCYPCLLTHPNIPNFVAMARWQLASDLLIALAYFSIPIELLYFIYRTQVFPYKWVVVEFGAFIVLCGLTHLMNIWTNASASTTSFQTMTFFKACTALVSCATAVTLTWVIPELLSVKTRELLLAMKTAELNKEVGKMKKDGEAGQHVRMLTHEIRSTLDRHTILKTTLVELSQILKLESCDIWMPSAESSTFELTHELKPRIIPARLVVQISDESIQNVYRDQKPRQRYGGGNCRRWRPILNTPGATIVSRDSSLAAQSCLVGPGEINIAHDRVVAVRLPCMGTAHFGKENGTLGHGQIEPASTYALLVLVLPDDPGRQWQAQDLDVVTAVADQVAVALSHATVLEESMHARDQLVAQNTSLHIARLEAEQAIAARNDFLAVMNHEMRTPMHAIIALTSILMNSELTADQRTMIETVAKSSSLLASLINDILDFTRLESGGLTLELRPFDLHTLMKEVDSIVQPLASAKELPVTLSLPPDLPTDVLGDSTRILQIMLNVIGNAIKFTIEGQVQIAVYMGEKTDFRPAAPTGGEQPTSDPQRLEHQFLHIEVRDTGIGIRSTDLPRLFDKFVQADNTITRNFGGTGLGLAISRKFIELMGGRIWLESEGLGIGTTCKMYVALGIYKTHQLTLMTDASEKSSLPLALKDLKVMVVDDNSINRVVTRRLLENMGCKTTVLESGQRCLEVLSEKGPHEFQVILLDLCMPEMDGFTVAREIFQKWGRVNRPVIAALTANTDSKTRERCFEIGMDDVLMKPISLNLLRTELNKLLASGASKKDSAVQTPICLTPSSNAPPSLPQVSFSPLWQ